MDIENAEGDEILEIAIAPVKQKQIIDFNNENKPANLVNMVKGKDIWLLGDANGKIWKMNIETLEYEEVTHFHSGAINDLVVNSFNKSAITIGQDGEVKLWDFIKDKEMYSRKFMGAALCADHLPYSDANQGKITAVGFDNGIVRVLGMGETGIDILKAFKAHDTAVVAVKFSQDGTMFATASKEGEIFFFNVSAQDYL